MKKKNRNSVNEKFYSVNNPYASAILSALHNQITDGIYFKDLKSRFIWINRAQANHFEIKDISDVIGKTDFDFFSEEHARAAYEDEQRIIQTGESIQKDEEETYHDKPSTWVSTVKMPFYDLDGKIIGTCGISRNITTNVRSRYRKT